MILDLTDEEVDLILGGLSAAADESMTENGAHMFDDLRAKIIAAQKQQ